MSEQHLNVSVDNGKYTVIMEANGRMHALRYGEPWQDLSGNKLVYCLAAEVEALRNALHSLVYQETDGRWLVELREDTDASGIVGDLLKGVKTNG